MDPKDSSPWFANWFDSPYYPILYKDRDDSEAECFLTNLVKFLSPNLNSRFLDLACGRGRHAAYLANLGYSVTGLDLSPSSISYAKGQFSQLPNLNFGVQDMRTPLPGGFDYVLNLFTSFGYFESEEDNRLVLRNVYQSLNRGGTFVMDFLNLDWVASQLVKEEEKTIEGISFSLKRKIENSFIIKDISFSDRGISYQFQEKVQALSKAALEIMAKEAGFTLGTTWGDYQGGEWNSTASPRCILFFHK